MDHGKRLEIMVNDVTFGKDLFIGESTSFQPISYTPFVPYCDFQQPQDDFVDFETSFPFSRFVGGEQYVELKFAVGGAKYYSQVTLLQNGEVIGDWMGVKTEEGSLGDLTSDEEENLRVLTYYFSKIKDKDTYSWMTHQSFLIVNVDWTQTDESSEVDECKKPQSNLDFKTYLNYLHQMSYYLSFLKPHRSE
ncbi:hypothetical protein ACTXT7_016894 [Hymenolepis weldensis]